MKKGLSLIAILSVLLTAGCAAKSEPAAGSSGAGSIAGAVGTAGTDGAAGTAGISGTAPSAATDSPAATTAAPIAPAASAGESSAAEKPAADTALSADKSVGAKSEKPAESASPTEPEKPAATAPAATYGPHDIGGVGADGGYGDEVLAGLTESGMFDIAEDVAFADAYDEAAMLPAEAAGDCDEIWIDPPYEEPQIPPEAGLLTGGEWRDNDHWSDWNALYGSRNDWEQFKSDWRIPYEMRIAVTVTSAGKPIEGARVSCPNAYADAVTDNKGRAYLFYKAINGPTEPITAQYLGLNASVGGVLDNAAVEIELDGAPAAAEKKLDFMIMCDTTGSMWDELSYLQEELKDIITRVREDNANIPTRLSVNFYRDEGDEYVVREYPFTTDINAACSAIAEQSAAGGGDFPEAVHTALESAVNNHDWDEDSVKILFLVLDAPPHDDVQIVDSVNLLIKQAAEKGIRIIPIASSGIDKTTEYLLRTMAFTTGGTYTFLTDDSGIGGGHIEPTVGAYNVEKLNDMMVRIVNGYLE